MTGIPEWGFRLLGRAKDLKRGRFAAVVATSIRVLGPGELVPVRRSLDSLLRQPRVGLARADEHVLGAGRRVEEVPGLQPPLLALDEEQGLAEEDEEVLLGALAMVEAVRLAGQQGDDPDPELVEPHVGRFELPYGAHLRRRVPGAVPRVEDEPALRFGCEPGLVAPEARLGDHADQTLSSVISITAEPTSSRVPGGRFS